MELNFYGCFFIALAMIPDVISDVMRPDHGHKGRLFDPIALLERVSHFACLVFMILQISDFCLGWWSDEAFAAYLVISTAIAVFYLLAWILYAKKHTRFWALAHAAAQGALFLFGGIMSRSLFLILSAFLFIPCHITRTLRGLA